MTKHNFNKSDIDTNQGKQTNPILAPQSDGECDILDYGLQF